jgi:hypothetical protein
MRTYRGVWCAIVSVVAAASLVAGVATIGWVAVAAATASSAVLGVVFGLAWVSDPRIRRRAVIRTGSWFGLAGVLIVGLPDLVGPWSVLILAMVGGLAPELVAIGARSLRARLSPLPAVRADELAGLSVRDLQRRWRRTTDDLHRAGMRPAAVVDLVEQRAALLDELERRDPQRFPWPGAANRREPQDR